MYTCKKFKDWDRRKADGGAWKAAEAGFSPKHDRVHSRNNYRLICLHAIDNIVSYCCACQAVAAHLARSSEPHLAWNQQFSDL
jgi:hypothetical protein